MSFKTNIEFIIVTAKPRYIAKVSKSIYEYTTNEGPLEIWQDPQYPNEGYYPPGTKIKITSVYSNVYNNVESWKIPKNGIISVLAQGVPIPIAKPTIGNAPQPTAAPQTNGLPPPPNGMAAPPTQNITQPSTQPRQCYALMNMKELEEAFNQGVQNGIHGVILGHIEKIMMSRQRMIQDLNCRRAEISEIKTISKRLQIITMELNKMKSSPIESLQSKLKKETKKSKKTDFVKHPSEESDILGFMEDE